VRVTPVPSLFGTLVTPAAVLSRMIERGRAFRSNQSTHTGWAFLGYSAQISSPPRHRRIASW